MTLGDHITLAALDTDPDPILAELRAHESVSWVPALSMWLVTRWDDVAAVEAQPELFTAATEPSLLRRALGPNMLTLDPPACTRLQQIMAPPFQSSGRSGRFTADELPVIADQLLDQVPAAGFDVMASYAQPLSAGALATVLGLDSYGFDRMWAWCEGLCTDIANMEDDPDLAQIGAAAKEELGAAIHARIADASLADDDAAISRFVANGATPDEIVNNVRLMISGGINEPRDGIGLVTWVMLTRPDLRAAALAEARAMRRLIEEVFRVYSPVGTVTRQATADTTLAGVQIRRGDLVSGVLRSVNLDETHWDNPTEIVLDRKEGAHAAFALGAHRCLGEWLGRQEVRVGVARLFERFPKLRLDPNHEVELTGFEFRGPKAVHVIAT